MIPLIDPDRRIALANEPDEMHRLRNRVFKERLNWGVESRDGLEIDEFDANGATYLLQCGAEERIQGCVRWLTEPTSR